MANSSPAVAGTDALADQYNDLRKDALFGETYTTTGSANAYAFTADAAYTAYVNSCFKIVPNFTNTGPITVNVSTLGAKSVVAPDGTELRAGQSVSGLPMFIIYNTTLGKFVAIGLNEPIGPNVFGGTGADGALDTSGGTVNIDLGGANVVVKNYTSINVVTNNLTFSNPATDGTTIILKSRGNVKISATINAQGMGAAENAAAYIPFSSTDHQPTDGTAGALSSTSLGANGTAPTGGSQLDYIERVMLTNTADKLRRKCFNFSHLCGQGTSTVGTAGETGKSGGPAGGTAGARGASGNNGPLMFIECAGAWDFTGTIDVSGANGSNGGTGGNGAGPAVAGQGSAGGGGGGGGGAGGIGGFCIVQYGSLISNAGTINSAGGTGGTGGAGGSGGDGDSGSTWDGGAGGGGGAGAASAGTYSAAGAACAAALSGQVYSTVDGRGGAGGTGGSGGAGGGTMFGGAGSAGSVGTRAVAASSTSGTAGGAGGAGGAGAASIGGLVVSAN